MLGNEIILAIGFVICVAATICAADPSHRPSASEERLRVPRIR